MTLKHVRVRLDMDQSQSIACNQVLGPANSGRTQRIKDWWISCLTLAFEVEGKKYSTQPHMFNQVLWPPNQHPLALV